LGVGKMCWGMLIATTRPRPNQGLQRTALCAHKIGAILKVGISSKAFPTYGCAAAEAQAGRPRENGISILYSRNRECGMREVILPCPIS